ncbi:hypothetical protein HLBENOHH_02447 [Aeromonas dhakensis]|uniref:hypothetical protein n=1 Tax=Aeromonas dhakensis TaxID=196024 RepID=UPI0036722E6A
MAFFIGFIMWLVYAFCVAKVASVRGRSFFTWLIISMLLSPIMGLAFLCAIPNLAVQEIERKRHDELIKELARK